VTRTGRPNRILPDLPKARRNHQERSMDQKIFSARKVPASGERHKPTKRFQQNADGGVLASRFSSCGSCHGLGRYSPTPASSRAFRLSFSHADHGGRRDLNCQSCHKIRGRGLPQRTQVSSIIPAEHFVTTRAATCKTCHNARSTFGDHDTHDCKRCHRRDDFRMPR